MQTSDPIDQAIRRSPCMDYRVQAAVADRRAIVALSGSLVVCAALMAVAPRAWAEQPAAQTGGEKQAEDKGTSRITRADLAASYLRLEQAYLAHPPQGDDIAVVNRAFDQATLAFFTGRNAEAIQAIDNLTAKLDPALATGPQRALVSLKVVIDPPVWVVGQTSQATLQIASIYEAPLPAQEELSAKVRIVGPQGEQVWAKELPLRVGAGASVDVRVPVDLPSQRLDAGVYRVELSTAGGQPLSVGRVSAVQGPSLDQQRAANQQRLESVSAVTPAHGRALATCRARNQLLADRPSQINSAQFLADLNRLAAEVATERDAVAAGQDPYYRRRGDYWRVLTGGTAEIPLRVYAPESAAGEQRVPLLIVLHGAGGDENMFFEAYGAGMIKKLADEKGMLVVAPLTYKFGSNPKNIELLIESLGDDYAIDLDRVYVLGHSMGASATSGLARGGANLLAAACCVAGGNFSAKDATVPVLVVVSELDAVVPPKSVLSTAEKAVAAGKPLEVRTMNGYGHTLVMGVILPEAVDWLLNHRRAP